MRGPVVVLYILGGLLTIAAVVWLWHRNAARGTALSMRRRRYEEQKDRLPGLEEKAKNNVLDDTYERLVLGELRSYKAEVLDPELGHGNYYGQRIRAEASGPALMGVVGLGISTVASVLSMFA